MTTLHELLCDAETQLGGQRDDARLDAEVLLAFTLGKPRSHLHAWPEQVMDAAQVALFEALVARRATGEPVAHLTGTREFWSLELSVTPDTLIPRPESELLVECALRCIPTDAALAIADLGTGSGAIALAIARERPNCHVVATDVSPAALTVARANAERHAIGNVAFRTGDWCAVLGDSRYAVIVSNPPYIRTDDPHLTEGDVRFEPRTALTPGPDGLEAIRLIVAQAHVHLSPGGWLLLEHGYDQSTAVTELLRAHGYHDVADHSDLAGHGRVAQGRR